MGPSSPSSSSRIGGPPVPPGRRSLDRSWREIFSRLLRRHTELLVGKGRVPGSKPWEPTATPYLPAPRQLPSTFGVCCRRAPGAPGPCFGRLPSGSAAAEGGDTGASLRSHVPKMEGYCAQLHWSHLCEHSEYRELSPWVAWRVCGFVQIPYRWVQHPRGMHWISSGSTLSVPTTILFLPGLLLSSFCSHPTSQGPPAQTSP